ncbi:MAG: stage II sporulation protein D [Eubacteriales bacterium]|nr:stage II sporulation protein D [Eubacteriales bacterium]
MKKIILSAFLLISLVYLLPLGYELLVENAEDTVKEHTISHVEKSDASQDNFEQIASKEGNSSENSSDVAKTEEEMPEEDVCIAVSINGSVQEMNLEEYVAGVTAAEMPASFPEEALKAQAIAARTFAQSKRISDGDDTHPDADVCDDYTHCAAYLDLDTQAEEQWGSEADEWRAKIEQAVQETRGEIVTYQGEPITAVFHAACSEETESAVDVWGADIPYLVSVESTGDDACPDYTSSVTFGAEEFRQLMLQKYEDINLTGMPKTWFTDFERADAGNVLRCTVGGVHAKGTTLRSLLGLRSTNFTVSTTETSITFETTGYGHAVGMSQYGAKGMAEEGKTCEEILTHYYTDTEISKITE